MHIVAIGGGELGAKETLALDEHIVRAAGGRGARALFVPTASGDAQAYCEAFERIYGDELGCRTAVLRMAHETPSPGELAAAIARADLIYVGGGNTRRMLERWQQLGVGPRLRLATMGGAVLCGLSAGALCWFRYANSDAPQLEGEPGPKTVRVEGLGLIDAAGCPHMLREPYRWAELARMMRDTPGACIALDDWAALEVRGSGYRILAARPEAGAHRCAWRGEYWEVEQLTGHEKWERDSPAFRPLDELIHIEA